VKEMSFKSGVKVDNYLKTNALEIAPSHHGYTTLM